MRRMLALLLAVLLCLSLSACTSGRGKNYPDNPDNPSTTTPSPSTSPSPSPIPCPTCSGLKVCTVCYGEHECLECEGTRKSKCWDCTNGDCMYCSGDGGSYSKNYYTGKTEWVRCSTCSGSGKCGTCKGSRYTTCRRCGGSGGGCTACSNSGRCFTCGGVGTVTEIQTPQDNVTEAQRTSNYLIATIDGTEYIFDLGYARVNTYYSTGTKYVQAYYEAKNPGGGVLYKLYISFDPKLTCGTYAVIGDNNSIDLGFMLTPTDSNIDYTSARSGAASVVGSFTITEISGDSRTYSGSGNATLKPVNHAGTITLDISYFNFTLS